MRAIWGRVVRYPRGNATASDLSARRVTKLAQDIQIYPKGNAMTATNLPLALRNFITEAAELQYIVDCESEYLSPSTLERHEKRIAYLCKLIAKLERQMLLDTAH